MRARDRRWIRHLGGELEGEERRQLESQLRDDPQLARRYERFEALWRGLEGPPASAPEADFSLRVVAAAQRLVEPISWRRAPLWVRLGSVAALLCGMTLGSVVSAREGAALGLGHQGLEQDLRALAPGSTVDDWTLLASPAWREGQPLPLEDESPTWPSIELRDTP